MAKYIYFKLKRGIVRENQVETGGVVS